MQTKQRKKDKVNVITLGCSKNLVDSQNMITQLHANDIDVHHESGEDANVIIINTCGFIDRAKEESIDTILAYSKLRSNQTIDRLFVTGCLSERYRAELKFEIPEVDDWFGTMELPALLSKFNVDYRHELVGERHLIGPKHYAYVKISEGCNRTCSFCAIPLMRGKHISKTIDSLVKECVHLAKNGVKEILLIAQELTYYGLDIYKKRALPDLLNSLCEVNGIEWIRLHYTYPSKFPREVFEVMAKQPKICNYLDIPLQHANDQVLHRMKRQISQSETRDLISYARSIVPDIAIRTTMLVGFPNETKEEYGELKKFIQEMRFERLGVFEYSHEENTAAYEWQDNVPSEIKSQRAAELMELQEQISYEINQQKIGETFKVIIDRKEGEYFIGRTAHDSPEVDNEVLIRAASHYLRIGDFVQVIIIDVQEFDLYAKLV